LKYAAFFHLWVPRLEQQTLYVLDVAKKIGFQGMEISTNTDTVRDRDLIKKLMQRAKQGELQCFFSTGLDEKHNIVSPNGETRRKGIDFLKKCIDLSHECESEILGGILYGPWGVFTGKPRTEKEWEYSKECMWEVAEHAQESGVFLAIEPVNRFESYMLFTAQEARRYIEEIGHPHIKVHLDTFQMNIEENSMYEAIITAGDLLFHFHCCESHRGIPGTGHLEWDEVFKALHEVRYERWLVIESFTPDIVFTEGGSKVAIWRKFADPTEIAEKGLAFLRNMESTYR